MYEVDELRAVHDAIKTDLNTGYCTPERLLANLQRFYLIIAEIEGDEAQPLNAAHYGGWGEMAASYRRARFQLIEGGRE